MDKRRTILVVDDETALARTYDRILSRKGFDVVLADSYESAVAALEEKPIDLVITDLALPGKNGIELMRTIREDKRWSELPIIAQSGFGQQMQKEVLALMPLRLFQKPVPMDELVEIIEAAFNPND